MSHLIRRAVQLQEKGELDKAERLYRTILAAQPRHFEALHRLGLLRFHQGRHAEALEILSAAVNVNRRDAAALSNCGLVQAALGRPAEALANFDAALALKPDLASALNNRGISLRELGRPMEAVASYDRAVTLKPDCAEAHKNRGNALRDLQRPEEALSSYDRALATKPNYVEALYGRACAMRDLLRLEDALASCDRALAVKPEHAGALNTRGNALRDLDRFEEGLASHDRAIALKPDFAEAIVGRGLALRALGRLEEALSSFDRAILLRPDHPEAFNGRGVALRGLERQEEALKSYDRALALDPGYAEAHNNRANALLALHQPAEALASYDRALALDPGYAQAHVNRAGALLDLEQPEEALAACERALALNPRYAAAHEIRGVVLGQLGRLDRARDSFETAIRQAPRRVRSYYNLASLRRWTRADPHVEAMEALARDMNSLTRQEQIELNFVLGKAYADMKDHERSFHHMREGNALKRQSTPYDEAGKLARFERTCTLFDAAFMRERAGQGDPSSRPIFIFGMPRSGTTLIEQILASHPEVRGGGETDLFANALASLDAGEGKAFVFPDDAALLSAERLRRLGADYVGGLRQSAAEVERIADKTIDNFRFAGLIHLALPNASLIHARRDPMDTCVSCFSNLFGGYHPYAYDLGELGRYYQGYDALMRHWRDMLPVSVMLDVQYEDVVDDLEGQARLIVAHCGLEWDPRCLDFHLTERLVRTASATQVRQPIYRGSVQRWRAYEPLLDPLLQELRPRAA